MTTKGYIGALVLVIAVAALVFVFYKKNPQPAPGTGATTTPATSTASSIDARAEAVLHALKDQSGTALAALVHPTKGVRFSPYGHISTSTDMVLMAEGLEDIYTLGKIETWGSYDGSGEPIKLTFKDYYKKFLYDVDFLNAPQKAVNTVLGHGNTLINVKQAYPNATFVEYYFSGFEAKYEGMDWRSLRLIFEKEGETWYLVGIAHDQWTI